MKRKGLLLFLGFITLALILFPESNIQSGKAALTLCFTSVIPSLFPFFVLCRILIDLGAAELLGKYTGGFMKKLFHISPAGVTSLLMGLISGYPLGAKVCCELYQNKSITKTDAERLLAFCNNAGPVFITGTVGTAMLGSFKWGLLLMAVHIISALCTGFLFRFYKKSENAPMSNFAVRTVSAKSLPNSIASAFSDSISSILSVCGYVVFFAVFINILKVTNILQTAAYFVSSLFPPVSTEFAREFLSGLLEMTNGIANLAALPNINPASKLIAASMLLGFGGLCVHFQTMGIVSRYGLSSKTYFLGKMMNGTISAVIMFALLVPAAHEAFYFFDPSAFTTTRSLIAFVLIFFFYNLIVIGFLGILYFIECYKERKEKKSQK